jgi:tryptophan halogenase
MRSLLLGGALGVPFESWDKWLLCDRAQAVPCASVSPLTPYTRSTAHGAGWQWRIPLQHRIGNGVVYASAQMSDEAAAEHLLGNLDGAPLADPRPISFTAGRRARSWEKNVVAIGLSSGFLEPLESTSIHLIQTAILRLIALFPGAGVREADQREYNVQTNFELEDIRDFLIAHYKVTDREDSEFWRYLKHMTVPDSLKERLELFRTSARFFVHGKAELFREESWVQVLIGQGLEMRPDPMVDIVPEAEALNYLRDMEEVIADVAGQLPDHARFIAQHCPAPPIAVTGMQQSA